MRAYVRAAGARGGYICCLPSVILSKYIMTVQLSTEGVLRMPFDMIHGKGEWGSKRYPVVVPPSIYRSYNFRVLTLGFYGAPFVPSLCTRCLSNTSYFQEAGFDPQSLKRGYLFSSRVNAVLGEILGWGLAASGAKIEDNTICTARNRRSCKIGCTSRACPNQPCHSLT